MTDLKLVRISLLLVSLTSAAAADSVEHLISDLGARDPMTRAAAAAALEALIGTKRDPARECRAIAALKEAAASNPDIEIRASAAEILKKASREADRKEIARLIREMKAAKTVGEGARAFKRILGKEEAGVESLAEAFAPDRERYGKNADHYALEAVLSAPGPLVLGQEGILSVTLTNRGKRGIWISPAGALLDGSLPAEADCLFDGFLSGDSHPFSLLHLEPGESRAFSYALPMEKPGPRTFTFRYSAADPEEMGKAVALVCGFGEALAAQAPPAPGAAAPSLPPFHPFPTAFREVGATLSVDIVDPAGDASHR